MEIYLYIYTPMHICWIDISSKIQAYKSYQVRQFTV